MEQHVLLEPGRYYHIFNRGIDGTNVFREERNYADPPEPVRETRRACRRDVRGIVGCGTTSNCWPESRHPRIPKTFEVSETSKVFARSRVPDATQGFADCFNAYAKAINKT